jgi:uncharacterized membrane protein
MVVVLKIIEFLSTFLLTLIVGVFWGTWLSLTRNKAVFPVDVFLAVGKRMINNLALPMRILTPATLVSFVLLCAGLYHAHQTSGLVLSVAAVVCLIIAMVTTISVNVPIDYQVKSWSLTTMPSDWQSIWRRWCTFHALRSLLSLIALACSLAALLIA